MRKNILVVSGGMEVGGVERSLLGLLGTLDSRRYKVDLFLFEHAGEFMQYIPAGVHMLPENRTLALAKQPIAWLFRHGHWGVGTIRLLAKLLGAARAWYTRASSVNTHLCHRMLLPFIPAQEKPYEVALGFFAPHDYISKKVKAKVKVGWVHTDYSAKNVGVDKVFERKMWAALDYLAPVSDSCSEAFLTVYPEFREKIRVVENILDPALIRRQAGEFSAAEEMPPVANGYNLCTVGRYCDAKAFDWAISACAQLKRRGAPVRWYAIGYGPDESMMKRLIAEKGLRQDFILLGKKVNPYPYIKACDIYVQPSRYEGKAVAVREAQILGRPVLITNFATAQSQLRHGHDGHICELSIEGVVQGVEYLIANDSYRRSLASNALPAEVEHEDIVASLLSVRGKEGSQ